MKSSILIILSFLLVGAILAPSIITLIDIGEKRTLVIDFNEEEKKEEKKEAKEKDFFLDSNLICLEQLKGEKVCMSPFYVENDYSTSLSILLPPPEHLL